MNRALLVACLLASGCFARFEVPTRGSGACIEESHVRIGRCTRRDFYIHDRLEPKDSVDRLLLDERRGSTQADRVEARAISRYNDWVRDVGPLRERVVPAVSAFVAKRRDA